MYAKVFQQIFDSSIAEDYRLRHFFMDMLVLADSEGRVDMTPRSIAARTNIPIDDVLLFLSELEKPDTRSRSIDHDGARLTRLDSHRDWGWQIVNYQKYRDVRSEIDRSRLATTNGEVHYGGYVYFASLVGDEGKVKIGYSTNPWARAMELSTGAPEGVVLLGCIKGGPDTETKWHERFASVRLNGEWFTKTPELDQAINSVVDSSLRKILRRSYRRSKQRHIQKQKQIQTQKHSNPQTPDGEQAHFPEVNGYPTLPEVVEWASIHGLAKWRAQDWWYEMKGCGWKDHNQRPIQDWQSVLIRVRTKWESDGRPNGPPKSRQAQETEKRNQRSGCL